MYIDTSTKESLELSVLKLLNIDKDKLYSILEECYQKFEFGHQVLVLDDQYDYLYAFVKEHMHTVLDEVMLIHLSRRIDNGDNNGYGLIDMLTKKTSLSSFLKEYGISFKYEDKQIRIFVNNIEISIDEKASFSYQKFVEKIKLYYDLEFCGYAVKNDIKKVRDYDLYCKGPDILEFIYLLGVDDDLIIDTFMEKSEFFQLEYVVPLKDVTIDYYEELIEQDKQFHLVIKAMHRLYLYKYDEDFIGEDSTVLRMKDNQILNEKYFITKSTLG